MSRKILFDLFAEKWRRNIDGNYAKERVVLGRMIKIKGEKFFSFNQDFFTFFMEVILKNELLTVNEVAEYLKISKSSVFNLSRKGELPHGIKIGGLRRWNVEELEAFVKSKGTTGENVSDRETTL